MLLAILDSLELPHAYSEDGDIYHRQIWSEIIAFSDPSTVFALAAEIDAQLPPDYVEIDPQSLSNLRARYGELDTNLALRVLGFRCRERGYSSTSWTNAPIRLSGQKITLEL